MTTGSIKNKQFSNFSIDIKYIVVILSIAGIYTYVSILKSFYKSEAEEKDILNKKLLELDICGWNLLHVLFYFSICYIFNIKTIIGYIFIFSIGIAWFFLEKELFSKYNKHFIENNDNNKNYVYSSISYPRYDDIIFNSLGILLHFLITKCYFKL